MSPEPASSAREKQTLGGPAFGWTAGRKSNAAKFCWRHLSWACRQPQRNP